MALTQFYRIERNAFSLTNNKLRLSVSNDLNIIPTFLPLSRAFIVTITILEYILVYSTISLFYTPYTTTVAQGGLGSLKLQQIFKSNLILKRFILNAFLVQLCVTQFPNYWYNYVSKILFVTSTPCKGKMMLFHCNFKILLAFSEVTNFILKLSYNSVTLAQLQMYQGCLKLQKPRICLCQHFVGRWVGLEEKLHVDIPGIIESLFSIVPACQTQCAIAAREERTQCHGQSLKTLL